MEVRGKAAYSNRLLTVIFITKTEGGRDSIKGGGEGGGKHPT